MSFSSEEEVFCPCGEEFTAQVWNSVNFAQDPGLRDRLMGGALNVAPCPMCRTLVYADRFILVHDPASELMAFVHPKAREKEAEPLREKMLRDFSAARDVEGGMRVGYGPLLFFGIESLVELLKREEEENDQAAVAESFAARAGTAVRRLPRAKARAAGLPPVLPFKGEGTPDQRLRAGLDSLLAANDRLTAYAAFRERLSKGNVPLEGLS